MSGTHENLASFDERDPPSIRGFGITIAAVLGIISVFPLIVGSGGLRLWTFIPGVAILAAAYLAPALLEPLNRLWFKLGMVLHRVINPLVLGLIFAMIIVPTALGMRLFGRRPIVWSPDPQAQSYWIPRDPPGPEADSLKNQF